MTENIVDIDDKRELTTSARDILSEVLRDIKKKKPEAVIIIADYGDESMSYRSEGFDSATMLTELECLKEIIVRNILIEAGEL